MTRTPGRPGAARRGRGPGLAEYAVILSIVIIVAVVALLFIGGNVTTIVSAAGASA